MRYSEGVSRSQALLQYLMALEVLGGDVDELHQSAVERDTAAPHRTPEHRS